MPEPPDWLDDGDRRVTEKGNAAKAFAERSYDPVAEEVCVASVTLYPDDCWPVWSEHCTAADLYDPGLRTMMAAFEAAMKARGAAVHLDVVTALQGGRDEALLPRYLGLARCVSWSIGEFVRTVSVLSKQRAAAAQVELALVHYRKATTATEKAWALQRIEGIRFPSVEAPTPPEGRGALLNRLFNETTEGEVGGPSVRTGFNALDRPLAGGFRAAKVYCCGARPQHGKTAFALQLCIPAAKVGRVAFVSLEMQEDDLLRRLASVLGKVSSYVKPKDYGERLSLQIAYSDLSELDFHVWDKPYRKWGNVEEWLAGLHAERPLSLVVVDYLQLMTGHGKQREDQDVTENVQALKRLAKLLQVPVLVLSQVTDDSAPMPNHRYKSRDLAKSRGIEQGCDVIWFLWRPVDCQDQFDDGYCEVQVTKNKFGKSGVVARMHWDGPTYTFSDTDSPVQLNPK